MEQTDSRKMIKKIAKNYQQRTNQINKIQKSIKSMKNQSKSLGKKTELALPPISLTISNPNKLPSPLSFSYNKLFIKQQNSNQLTQRNEQNLKVKDHYLIRKLLKSDRNRNTAAFNSFKSQFENQNYSQKSREFQRDQSLDQVASQSLNQYLQQNKIIFTNSTNPRVTQRIFTNLNMSGLNHKMVKFNSISFKQNSPPSKYTTLDDQIGLTSQIQQSLMRTHIKFQRQKDSKRSQSFRHKVHIQNLQDNIKNLRYEQERIIKIQWNNLKQKRKQITLNQYINKQETLKKSQKILLDYKTISQNQQDQQKTVKKIDQRKKTQPQQMRNRQSKLTEISQFQTQDFSKQKYSPWENKIHQFELDNGFFNGIYE